MKKYSCEKGRLSPAAPRSLSYTPLVYRSFPDVARLASLKNWALSPSMPISAKASLIERLDSPYLLPGLCPWACLASLQNAPRSLTAHMPVSGSYTIFADPSILR